MSWKQYRTIMERYAIKTDDMATEDTYFLATHMPFSNLEMYVGGKTSTTPKLMSEDEIFDNLIYNPNNEHRLIIVRGENGTGKSHLIRYFKAKFENSPSTIYDSSKEQLIFLRRLNNSVRGVFQQLIDQNVIKDPSIEAKIKKFIDSSDARDENTFKNDILFAYISAVSSDQTGECYKSVICKNIASYLSDSRVKEHLLREGGAISRCFNLITSPSDKILKNTTVFTTEDFDDRKIIRAVYKQGDPQASDFATTLNDDKDEIVKLVNYLNHFSRDVVQRCADISSESTENVFLELRRDLKRQNKNLTLFIEDFTGFTGIDSELITVLATEHGGEYADLCRVTSVIGITDAYYYEFRDNFTDRVTHQISVTDSAFGGEDFLVQMAAKYLNAIYCDNYEIERWYKDGAERISIPTGTFVPPCKWESVEIDGKEYTLYPFNKHALISMYETLHHKSPRMFLKRVIRDQLKEYFDGKEFNSGWAFPLNPTNIQMEKSQHSSSIDRLEQFSIDDRNRLKSLFALWGNGTASGIKDNNDLFFGGINSKFLNDVGLGSFTGIGPIVDNKSGGTVEPQQKPIESNPITLVTVPTPVDAATKNYFRWKEDIVNWFTMEEEIKYHEDYRKFLKSFIAGTAAQSGAINWQDMGIPAYIADQRLSSLVGYYIEGQDNNSKKSDAIVYMERSAESRDALLALVKMNYANGWDFDGATYYQQRLITWLEKRKSTIIKNVLSADSVEKQLPVLEWCLVIQFLKAKILGKKLNETDNIQLLKELLENTKKNEQIKRETKEWNDLIQFTSNRISDFDSALSLLQKASATTMGAIHFAANGDTKSCYRADELLLILQKLISKKWDISDELPDNIPEKHMLFNPAGLLKRLYKNIDKAMEAESKQVCDTIDKVKEYISDITKDNIIDVVTAIQDLFSTFSMNGILGGNELRNKYESAPVDIAKDIVKHCDILNSGSGGNAIEKLVLFSSNDLHEVAQFLRDLQTIAQLAEQEENKAKHKLKNIDSATEMSKIVEAAQNTMKELYKEVEEMEAYDVTDTNN